MERDFTWRELGERIRQRRSAANMSQQALADVAGLTQNAIFRLEAGETNPQLTTLQSIAHALGCSVRELLCGLPDIEPRMVGRLGRVRRLVESGDEAALRILDHGIEAAEALLERSGRDRKSAPVPERKLILKGERHGGPTDRLILKHKLVRARSEADDIPPTAAELIEIGAKSFRSSKASHETK
ncbi:MAG: helix-turn-helix transcriptional regulator [Silvibacterium sp.]